MSHLTFDDQLDLLESQLHELTGSLIDDNPALLQAASTKFQQLAVELRQMAKEAPRTKLGSSNGFRRISALANGMATFRENLLRRSAYIDCALGLLIPVAGDRSTYAGSRVYGSPARGSGSFATLTA